MNITRIETIPVQVPIQPRLAIRGSHGTHSSSPFLLVRVHTDAGLVGLGEVSATPRWSGEDSVTAAHFIEEYFSPLLVGADPAAIEQLATTVDRAVARNFFTKAALEMALWDIAGKRADLPLHRLLGGAVRDAVPIKWSVSGVEPERAAEIAAWAVEQGFSTLKVKVGIDPDQDVARVRAVRRAAGPDVRLGVDCNGGWSVEAALRMIPRLAELGVYFVEQPVAPGDPAEMAAVRAAVDLPIIADESVYSLEDAAALARAEAADVFSIYLGKAGGIGPARRIAAVAEGAGLTATIGSNLELGVATAAMIHVALATPGIEADRFPCDIIGPLYYESDILAQPLRLVRGMAYAPEGPGLGVELDMAVVERYRVDR